MGTHAWAYAGYDSDWFGHFAEMGREGEESSGGVHVGCGEGGGGEIYIIVVWRY